MTDQEAYFQYLKQRSKLGGLYRKYWLYPKVGRRLEGKTLDVGCGIGDMLTFRPQTVGVDVSDKTVAYCRERGLDARKMEPDVLPFANGEFETVLLDNVLEHIVDPSPLLAEVKRVLVPAGRFVVGVPGLRGWHSDPDHKVHYDESSLASTVSQAGFDHVETFYTPLWRSAVLDRKLRQYCVYGTFQVKS